MRPADHLILRVLEEVRRHHPLHVAQEVTASRLGVSVERVREALRGRS